MQKKTFSAHFEYEKGSFCCPGGLLGLIEYIESIASAEVQNRFLYISDKTKAIQDVKVITLLEFSRLKELVLTADSIKQKAALGILFRHINDPKVKAFVEKEITANYIRWDKFNNRRVLDSLGREYQTKIYNVAPLSYLVYFIPNFSIFCLQEHPLVAIDNDNHGLGLPRETAGRFNFSVDPDNYNFIPRENPGNSLSREELAFLLENTSIPDAKLGDDFIRKGLFSELSKLCFAILPKESRLFLTDIIEKDTAARLLNGESFAETLFGKAFLGAGFSHFNSAVYYRNELPETSPWYGIELRKTS